MLQLTFSERRYGHAIKQRKKLSSIFLNFEEKEGLSEIERIRRGWGRQTLVVSFLRYNWHTTINDFHFAN